MSEFPTQPRRLIWLNSSVNIRLLALMSRNMHPLCRSGSDSRKVMSKLLKHRHYSVALVFIVAALCLGPLPSYGANALEEYVAHPDPAFAWAIDNQAAHDDASITQILMRSQSWRGHIWRHEMRVIRPQRIRHPEALPSCL